MKKPSDIAICSVAITVGIAFLVMVAGVDPLIAPVIGAIFGTGISGIYGHWLRDEAHIKLWMQNLERNGQRFTRDPPATLRLTDRSFSDLPVLSGNEYGLSKFRRITPLESGGGSAQYPRPVVSQFE